MEYEVLILNEEQLEASIEKLLLEDSKDMLNFLYREMSKSKYTKKKDYKNKVKAKMSLYQDNSKILHKIH